MQERDSPTTPSTAPLGPDAGFWPRVGAKLIDHGLWTVIEVSLIAAGAYLNALGHPPWVIASGWVVSMALWYVYVYWMTRRRGQTVGKIAAHVQVAVPSGSPPGARRMLLRTLAEAVFDMCGVMLMACGWWLATRLQVDPSRGAIFGFALGSLLGLLDALYVLVSPRRQALHDRLAGTYVVRVSPRPMRGFVLASALAFVAPTLSTLVVVKPFLVEAYFVPSGSMEDTIQIHDRILANKLSMRMRSPRRYEIVMFKAPGYVAPDGKIFVKRVIGIAGDRVRVTGGKLYRNGKPIREPFIKEPPVYEWPAGAADGQEISVPEGHVVVLGDNRNNSADSHYWQRISEDRREVESAPFLPVAAIRGRLVYRYWPLTRMGTVAQDELADAAD